MNNKFESDLELLILETLDINDATLETLEMISEELELGFSLQFSKSDQLAH